VVRWFPVALLVACNGGPWDDVGPAVPASVRVELGDTPGLELVEGGLELERVDVDRCKARPSHTSLLGTWWVVPASPLLLEGGPWCALSFEPQGPLTLTGTDGNVVVDLTLSLPPVVLTLREQLDVDGDAFVLRLGDDGWLAADDLDLSEDGSITPSSPLHDPLVEALEAGAGLYRDDEDGELTDDELDRGPLTDG
jgi:hypothetical protein